MSPIAAIGRETANRKHVIRLWLVKLLLETLTRRLFQRRVGPSLLRGFYLVLLAILTTVLRTGIVTGAQSIGVPAQVFGLYKAHQSYGKLPWKTLFQPAISLCTNGFVVEPPLAQAVASLASSIRTNHILGYLHAENVFLCG
jgi:hypothetical protein